jgi:hypothetical protein
MAISIPREERIFPFLAVEGCPSLLSPKIKKKVAKI